MIHSSFDVRVFGASGVARRGRTLILQNRDFSWFHYPTGVSATVYELEEGAELDSVGIQKAIDAAHAAGGGTVVVPAGDYLIGPIRLRSRVNLHLEPGACLWGSLKLEHYNGTHEEVTQFSIEKSFERDTMRRFRRLISAVDEEDISITGSGQISGQSPGFVIPWMNTKPTKVIADRPSDTILFYRCHNVHVTDVRIIDTPNWTLVFDTCDRVRVRGVQIRCFDVINSDGIDLVDTTNATISDCDIWCCDDAICLKSANPELTTGRVTVTNCVIRTLCNSLKFGTDSAGVFEDITFSNIVVYNPDGDMEGSERGSININAIDGGTVRNVNISNVVMHNTYAAFYLVGGCRTVQQRRYRTPRPGKIENVSISNLRAEGTRMTSFIVGQPGQSVRDIRLTNIDIRKKGAFYSEMPPPVPERPEQYPTPFMFGNRIAGDQLPAYGIYMRHVEQIVIRDLRIESTEHDVRPPIALSNASDVSISGLKTTSNNWPEVVSEPDCERISVDGVARQDPSALAEVGGN